MLTTLPSTASALQVFATPAVRRVSREFSVDLDHVVGTGKDGRVLKGVPLWPHSRAARCTATPHSRTGRRVLAAA
jgi:pyruvate/2-oxoglutarate dehydrogenase complex dihydrolipoamide acyltransferase (E2) component